MGDNSATDGAFRLYRSGYYSGVPYFDIMDDGTGSIHLRMFRESIFGRTIINNSSVAFVNVPFITNDKIILSSATYGLTLPAPTYNGELFFKIIN
jgi:hypothetical protein